MPLPDVVSGLLLSTSWGFDSPWERAFFAAMIVKVHCCFFFFPVLVSTERTLKRRYWAPKFLNGHQCNNSILVPNGDNYSVGLAGVLNALNADVLICGGIGGGAQTALAAAGIKLFGGVSGDADKAVEAFINDTLDYNPDVKCSHHEHSHGEGHTCGKHGCGNHSCH